MGMLLCLCFDLTALLSHCRVLSTALGDKGQRWALGLNEACSTQDGSTHRNAMAAPLLMELGGTWRLAVF